MAHEDLVAELKLEDKKLEERDFVRIEITPKENAKVTRNLDDWTLRVDEERTLPEWYAKDVIKAEKAAMTALEESLQINVALDKEEKRGQDQMFYAYGSSKVEAHDSSKVEAHDSSKVEAHDSSKVEAHDSSKVVAHDSSRVVAYGSSTVEAYDSSTVELKSATAVVLSNRKIFVTKEAKVIRASKVEAEKA
jgi:hypothetical protein